ncbi:MAG: methyltransferase domain-containing protein, partial [Chitinophagia bacterium]|nr:methyltransferase domain-containing protein [Chitinophagia bacterium]
MGNSYFQFKKFRIEQSNCAMKVTTDASLFGAWVANQSRSSKQTLDIGGGTGLLSLMLAQKNETKIDIIEIERNCFEQMKQNIENSSWKDRINCVLNDIIQFNPTVQYDIILSNPPFHEGQLKSDHSSVNLARHGDELTLEVLFNKVTEMITEDGIFYLLVPAYRDKETTSIALKYGMYLKNKFFVKQSLRHDPFRIMYAFSKTKYSEKEIEEIVIKDNKDQYTE